MNVNFNLLYLILQKALGKSRESHLNTRCQRPANNPRAVCSHHPCASREQRPFITADPPRPMDTRRPQFRAPQWHPRPGSARPQRRGPGSVCRPRGSPAERRLERRPAGRAASARGAHRSTTALGPRPRVLTLWPVAATPEPRTEQGSHSSRLEESGAAGHWAGGARGEGLRVELHLLRSALLPGLGRLALGTDPVPTFPSLSKGPGSSGVSTPLPWHLSLLTPAHSLEMEADLAATFHPQHP